MKLNLKSLALCAAMLSFGFADNAFEKEALRLGNIEWEEDTKEVQQETDKPIHYTLLTKFGGHTEMYIESKKVDNPTTATYKLYYNNKKFEINFTNADTFNVVLTIGKKGFAKKTSIILDQNDNLNIKEGSDHYTKNPEVNTNTYAKYVNLKYPKEIKDMEEIAKRIKLQKDLIFDTFRKNS